MGRALERGLEESGRGLGGWNQVHGTLGKTGDGNEVSEREEKLEGKVY